MCEERIVELKVSIHTNFEDGETLEETGNRIVDKVTEDLRDGETSAGVELISTNPLD